MANTPTLGQFLVAINGFVGVRNEAQITDYLALEPPFGGLYLNMINELNDAFPKDDSELLEQKCEQLLPKAMEGADGASWSAFMRFIACYLNYMRDVDMDPKKYLTTYLLLSELQDKANNALKHGVLGYLLLPVTIRVAKLMCRLAIGLDKRPELVAQLMDRMTTFMGDEEGEERETLPEKAAKIVQGALTVCISDRNVPPGGLENGRPAGKKVGIVELANLCLKILFQCRKTRNATYIFSQIGENAPLLAAYPKSQQITYLYYLGRFYYQSNHFFRAQAVLQQAYNLAPARQDCLKHRRLILVYLVAANIILGRFPSEPLLGLPEAAEFRDHFLPLCRAIKTGDLSLFNRHLDIGTSAHAEWLLQHRVLFSLRNRCEVLVWRSFIRRIFLLVGRQPDPSSRVAPTLDLDDLAAVSSHLLAPYDVDQNYIDPDFRGGSFGEGYPEYDNLEDADFEDADYESGHVMDDDDGYDEVERGNADEVGGKNDYEQGGQSYGEEGGMNYNEENPGNYNEERGENHDGGGNIQQENFEHEDVEDTYGDYFESGEGDVEYGESGYGGEEDGDFVDDDGEAKAFEGSDLDDSAIMRAISGGDDGPFPDTYTLESMLSSLIFQGFLGGYISHKQRKFAVMGAKQKGILAAGFPDPWAVMKAKGKEDIIPGWRTEAEANGSQGPAGGGRVIHLSGARPAGS